ncbi:uncharacterized protein PV09_02202 [Verruconis gallopava]|uniref:Uncharacterized protein n=1 Tax=Verruconis gallopava TaxID=253628 RepID=A0A0D1XX28_9PEZI|nr:uncharacterized protein PV09_02202 [Verruconis gallopava]KIW07356.1 hypothetical protein PV09_02202 [Verruconis gallopava]
MDTSQRSSSPPARGSSPAVSPTITHVSSRCPTPSAAVPEETSGTAPSRSSSPPPPQEPLPSQPSKMDKLQGESTEEGEAGTASQRPPLPPSSLSAPVGFLPRLLPLDVSEYSEPLILHTALPTSHTSLSELAHLTRLQRYQEQRRSHARIRLHRWLVSAGLSARLIHCGELVYRTLIEYFRNDEGKKFATLYDALHDVRSSCDATRRYALLEPDIENGKANKAVKDDVTASFSTFMHEIPLKIRNDILDFISEIRTNPDFLAKRICSLNQQELISLASFRPAPEPESVIGSGKGTGISKKPSLSTASNPVERLLSFQRHDPLSALIYTCFANSYGPDSNEDQRRTEAWATTCARLITEAKQGCEPLLKSILDAWARMRDWPAKANIELFLMQVLQDGQFLVEKADQVQTIKDEKALKYEAEAFFDRAIRRLFDVIDDEPSAGGMPEGIWEIGVALMKKLNNKKLRQAAENIIIQRWFLAGFLRNAIIYPESSGIMLGFHISTQAREKILKPIADEIQKQASAVFWSFSRQFDNSPAIIHEVKQHMENLLVRLRHPRANQRPILLPAKAVTSPRETSEVQPFLIVSPRDIITLVNALFPDRRPPSIHGDGDLSRRGNASTASSISGISIPFRSSSTPGDGSSVLSMSASSATSDMTSREPLLEAASRLEDHAQFDSETELSTKPTPTEEYGRKIRMACSEMARILGPEAVSGSCHPCAERWAVLFVTQDGQHLRTRMQEDVEDADFNEDDSPDSESDEEAPGLGMDLESDYHQLKDSICKLLQEYELPKSLAPESESRFFSNRSGQRMLARRGLRRTDPTHRAEELSSTGHGPSTLHRASPVPRQRLVTSRSNSTNDADDFKRRKSSDLVVMLEAAYHQCKTRNEYVDALLWHKTLEQLARLSSPSLTRDGYAPLLNYFARGPRDALSKSFKAIEKFEAWFAWLKQSQERYEANVEDMIASTKQLRDKMWFKTAVLTSAVYEEARNLAVALRMMAQPVKPGEENVLQTHRARQPSRAANLLLRTETQVMDLIATAADRAGPNKLVDEQADLTSKWLITYRVENLCKGEERIHRLCYEVDKAVNKLVGESRLVAPVLWSSDLYRRDKDILDSGRGKGDLWLTGVGNLSIAGDEEYETAPNRTVSRSLDIVQQPSHSSLRSISTAGSQQSLESSSKWSSANRGINIMDAQDYFGIASPAATIDTAVTFWSPFQSSGSSQTSTNIRPMTGTSSKGTVMLKDSASVNREKNKFIQDLKRALVGLLLSDLGTLVFNSGSETDGWFNGEIAEECILRKEADDRERKLKLSRKKSMRSLKSAASREQRATTSDRAGGQGDGVHSTAEHSGSSSDATARSSGINAVRKLGLLEFPYNNAYQRLLDKFATHPSPYTKLQALYDLQLLITAALSSKTGKHISRRETLPPVPQSPTLDSESELPTREAVVQTPQAHNLDEAIANVETRRSHTMNATHQNTIQPPPSPQRGNGRSPSTLPSTDMIVDVLLTLFRDAAIRPKTLFRDLQYVASFVPSSILDRTPKGKAFWDAALAALSLKQDVCRYMVEIADDIVNEDTQSRTAAHGAQAPVPENKLLGRWTMADAAQMYIITAKEGDPAAQRELAILYLTHPDLLPRTLLPMSKPREIFKESLLNRKREDPQRSDPMTMCVAQHWMELSKKGGDDLAIKYLRARDDMEKIP